MSETERDNERDSVPEIAHLKFCKKRNKKVPVFVTEFTNGNLSSNSLDRIKFESFKSSDDAENVSVHAKRTLLANNGRLNYSGTSAHEGNKCLQYFVGVRDKKTGKMKLYDTALFRMKPQLSEIVTTSVDSNPSPEKSYRESVQELTASFGSKVRQRAMNSMLKHTVSEPVFDESIILNSTPKVPEIETNVQTATYMPSVNREAACVQVVFDMNEIILPGELDILNEEANSLFSAPTEERTAKIDTFCNYVKTHFTNSKVDSTTAAYLIYYNYLVTFQHLKYTDIRKKDPVPSIPEPLKHRMLSTFTVETRLESKLKSRSYPQQMKDKLVAHILVLALHIDSFAVNVNSVINDLQNVATPKFLTIAQMLGCHASKITKDAEVQQFVVLKIPLSVMTPKYVRKSAFGK